MKIKAFFLLIILSLLVLLPGQTALAQEEQELTLSLSRDFGYGGMGNDIQGLFSMHAKGPDSLVRVEFFIDGELMAEDAESPFAFQFSTDNYPLGLHTLTAIGYTTDGQELPSREITVEFVSADEGWQAAGKILVPVLILVGISTIGAFVLPFISGKKRGSTPPGEQRRYGVAGGAICPRCKRPFSLNFLAPNMLVGKLDRCPHCGKYGIMRARSLTDLRAAEAAELQTAQAQSQMPEESEEERLRKELDDSKFHDV